MDSNGKEAGMDQLGQSVSLYVSRGWRVESTGPGWASLVRGRRVNHLLHLFLSVFTLGLWLPVWLIMGLTVKETRTMLRVAEDGMVRDEKGRPPFGIQPVV